MIVLAEEHYRDILAHSLNTLPIEACGLLGGVVEGELKIVKKVYGLINTDQSPEHFAMDPREQFAVIKDLRKHGWTMLGNFHSHPASPARPSEEDKRLAYDREASYLILSLLDIYNPVLKSFKITDTEAVEEKIILRDLPKNLEKSG